MRLGRLSYLVAGFLVASIVLGALALSGGSGGPVPAFAQTVKLYGTAHVDPEGDGGVVSGFYSIDPATGAATLITTTAYRGISGMDFHPVTGVLYAVGRRVSDDEAFLLTINPANGAVTEIGSINNEDFQRVPDVSFRNSDNALFAWDEYKDRLASIALATGAMTTFGNQIGGSGHGMAFSPTDTLYLAQGTSLVILNQATGAIASTVAGFSGMPGDTDSVSAFDFHPLTGQMYGVLTSRDSSTPQRYLGIINPANAAVSVIGQSVNGLDAIAFSVEQTTPTPTPTGTLTVQPTADRRAGNVGGAVGAVAAAAGGQAGANRAAAAATQQAVSPPRTGTGPGSGTGTGGGAGGGNTPAAAITPPNTGDGGLADGSRPWLRVALVGVAALTALGASWRPIRR